MFKSNFTAQTIVAAPLEEVWEFFQNPKALESLTTFPQVLVISPSKTEEGALITLEIQSGFFSLEWTSRITEVKELSRFVDEGLNIPFPFISWKHEHSFQDFGDFTGIADSVTFSSYLPAFLIKLGLKRMFRDRGIAVKKHFSIK
ncbi:hypothetical protein [Alteribacillus sp. HJP-4]|uniref:SRPBCC family protein n=1 Tax=Alteribacillus sp. HJP-4 TaxID=2775394 RepID=UPI0035CD3792